MSKYYHQISFSSNYNPDKCFSVDRNNLDISHNPMQMLTMSRNEAVVPGMPDPVSITFCFKQHGEDTADLTIQICGSGAIRCGLRFVRSTVLDLVRELIRHRVRFGAGTSGIRKHMHLRKTDLVEKSQRGFVVLLRFPRKTGDQIRCQCASRKRGAKTCADGLEKRSVILAVHSPQRAVASALQRKMEMVAYCIAFRQTRTKLLCYHGRLQRAETKPHLRRTRMRRKDGVCKVRSAGKIDTVRSDFDSREDEFEKSLTRESFCLRSNVFKRQAADTASGKWDHTIRTEVRAAILYFHHSACSAIHRAGRERLKRKAMKRIIHKPALLSLAQDLYNIRDKGVLIAAAVDDVRPDLAPRPPETAATSSRRQR